VERALADGLQLKEWWGRVDTVNGYSEPFEVVRTFNKADRALGFFERAPLSGRQFPVMGVVQESFFDQPKHAPGEAVRAELREFVLRYFLRVSDLRLPEAEADPGRRGDPFLPGLSWCPRPRPNRIGFGFSQLYYKLRGSGRVGKFPEAQEFAIIDLRQLGSTYEWVVLKVRLFDFNLTFRPLGPDGVALVLPLFEENYLVLSADFVTNRDGPAPGVLGEYGLGYALIQYVARPGVLAYGPGRFRAGFQLITFQVLDGGETHARLAFVVNQPEQILRLPLDPLSWGLRLADLMSLGQGARLFAPLRGWLDRLPGNGFDPLGGYIALANLATAGLAARELCVSREQLKKDFLVQHFMQHYQMLTGALLTWRRVPDWRDEAAIPREIVEGVAS
jgi:hypothetical protein